MIYRIAVFGMIAFVVCGSALILSSTGEPKPLTEGEKWIAARGQPWTADDEVNFQTAVRGPSLDDQQKHEFDSIAYVHEGRGHYAYGEVKPGMTLAQVEKILGRGVELASSATGQVIAWEYEGDDLPYGDTYCVIHGSFVNGKLVSKSIVRN